MTDEFRHDDAAYVLGVLSPGEHAAFEAHLDTCAACRERVAESRAAVGLLAGLSVADADDPGPIPDTLFPGLLRRAERDRTRGRWITGSLAALAAACVATLVVVLWPSSSKSAAPALAFTHVTPAPVSATATLVSKSWGTEIELHCRYDYGVDDAHPYRLIVFDARNRPHDAGSWTLVPGTPIEFTTGTALREADITRMQITLEDGSPILQLDL